MRLVIGWGLVGVLAATLWLVAPDFANSLFVGWLRVLQRPWTMNVYVLLRAAACLCIMILLIGRIARWWHAQAAWRWRWSVALVTGCCLATLAGIALLGIIHESTWLVVRGGWR